MTAPPHAYAHNFARAIFTDMPLNHSRPPRPAFADIQNVRFGPDAWDSNEATKDKCKLVNPDLRFIGVFELLLSHERTCTPARLPFD